VHVRQSGAKEDVRMPLALTLATLSTRRDFGDDWLVERKFDGERSVASNASDAVRLDSHRKGAYDDLPVGVRGRRFAACLRSRVGRRGGGGGRGSRRRLPAWSCAWLV
jgi:hypothetical protein